MVIYVVLFLLLAGLSVLDLTAVPVVYKRLTFVTSVLLLIAVSSIRWETGPDWDAYANFFERIDYFVYEADINFFEPGFTLLNLAAVRLGVSYALFMAVMAAVTIGLKAIVFDRQPGISFILMFLYYCYYLADIAFVRQFTAVSIVLFGLSFVQQRRLWPFLACVAIATSIHVSAILFVLAYWIYPMRLVDRTLYVVLAVGFLIGLAGVSGWAIDLVVRTVGVDAVVAEKLLQYDESGLETSHANPYLSYALGILKRAFILPLLIVGQRYVDKGIEPVYRGMVNLLVFGNLIYFMFILAVPVVTRLALPFLYMEIFLLSYLLVSVESFKIRVLFFLALAAFGVFRLYLFMAPYMDMYVPFQTIFDETYNPFRY